MSRGLRFRTLCPTLLLALAPFLLAGCSIFGKAASPFDAKVVAKAPVQTISIPGRKVLLLGLEQAGARVELGLGQQLQVRLLTKAALAPEWALVGLVPGVVEVQGPKFEPDARSNVSGEVEGDTVWLIRPMAAGTVTLRFEYRRPRNTAPAVQVVTFDVVVR